MSEAATTPKTPLPPLHKRGESDYAGISNRELLRLLSQQERESRTLERSLVSATEQLKVESARAAEGERQAREVARRLRSIHDARTHTQNEVERVTQELLLYKAQLDAAQREILRAQEVLDSLERERAAAEERAADARHEARKLKEEKLIALAREEGRRHGLTEGLRRGHLVGYVKGQESIERRSVLPVGSASRTETQGSARTAAESMRAESIRSESTRSPSLAMSQSMINFAPVPPTVVSAVAETSTPSPPPLPPPPAPETDDGEIHPTIIHDPPPPLHHPHTVVPPDGWIPPADEDGSGIHLPPPHELGQPIIMSPAPPPRPPSADGTVLMVPPPGTYHQWNPHMEEGGRRHRRGRSSPESEASTTLSQLDLISPPEEEDQRSVISRGRSSGGRSMHGGYQPRELSVIPEASPASVLYRQPSLDPVGSPFPVQPPTPSDSEGLRVPDNGYSSGGASMRSSMSSTIGITVQPPSRPASTSSGHNSAGLGILGGGLLSPDDANRQAPLPLLNEPPQAPIQPPVQPPVMPSYAPEPIALPSGQLPPGFVASPMQHTFSALGPPPPGWQAYPTSPQQPAPPQQVQPPPGSVSSTPVRPVPPPQLPMVIREPSRPPSVAPSFGRGGYVPTPPPGEIYSPVVSQTPHHQVPPPGYHNRYQQRPDPNRDPAGYVRHQATGGSAPPPPRRRYSTAESDASSEVTSSIGSEANTLTTPPPRTPHTPNIPLATHEPGGVSPGLYAEAPLPPGMAYPSAIVPPMRPPSASGSGYTSAGGGYESAPSTRPSSTAPIATQVYPVRPPSAASSSAYSRPPSTAPSGHGPPRPPSSAASRTTSRTGTTATRAAGVHIPSTVAGDTPRSAAGSLAGSVGGRRAYAGNTPGMRLERIDESGSDGGSRWGSSAAGSARAPVSASGSKRSKLGRYAPSVDSDGD